MPEFVIEREISGVGKLGAEDLQKASAVSCDAIRAIGNDLQWVQSYVTDDKIFCVYRAPSAEVIRQHAEASGFPANRIVEVRSVINPTTAE